MSDERIPAGHYVIRHTDANGTQMWWRADRSGYTSDLLAAGVYGPQAAARIEKLRPPQDKAVSLADALAGLGPRTVGDYFGLRSWATKRKADGS